MTVTRPPGAGQTVILPSGFCYVTDLPALAMPRGGFGVEHLAVAPPDFTFAF